MEQNEANEAPQQNPMLAKSPNRANSPVKKSQFYRQSLDSQEREEKKPKIDKPAEYGNPDYVCFKIGRLEFFVKATKFAHHSQYFSKMQANVQLEHAAEEFKEEAEIKQPQIVIRLPKSTLPSMLLLMIKYINNKFLIDSSMDPESSFHIAIIADELKMRKLESELLCSTIMQQTSKHNVLFYLNTTWEKVDQKRKQYRGVAMPPPIDSDSGSEQKRKKRKRRRRRDSSDSESSSEHSSSSCQDIDESDSEESGRQPRMVQIDIPYDQNEIIEELKESEDSWKELKKYCIDTAANNLNYLMETHQEDLTKNLKAEIVEQIIEKNMQFYRGDPSHDNRSLINLLKRIKKCQSVFELLKLEKEKIMEEQKAELKDYIEGHIQRSPILTWSVNNLTNYFYKQSNSIQIEGTNWRLALSYFKKQSTCMKVDIKIMNSPFDTKNAKDYFNKSSLAVPANLDVQKIDPMAQFEVEEVEIEDQQHRVNQLNASAAKFTNHAFVSFVASVDLFEDQPLNLPVIHSMICSQKQPVQLISVEDFDIAQLDGDPVDVSLNFQIKEMHSQLLSYISMHFTFVMNEPEIRFLSKEDFKLILRHKHLNVTQEDEVLKAICLWLEGQTLMMKREKYANVPKVSLNMVQGPNADFSSSDASSDLDIDNPQPKKKKEIGTTVDLASDLNDILLSVNWDYVSLPCLLDVLRSEPLFRKCDAFRAAIKAQFKIRINSQSQEAIDAAHNSFNNEPRFSYKFNTSQRNLYPNEEELAAQNRPQVVAKSGIKSQFQLLYPVQLYPDFCSHLIDCMINPIEIVKNWSIQAQSGHLLCSPSLKQSCIGPGFEIKSQEQCVIDQQATKRRLLQQQLLKKKLEMKHIEDQLHAMDLLDNLNQKVENGNQFSSLNDQIQKAKERFKMCVDQQNKSADQQQEQEHESISSCSGDSPRVIPESSNGDSADGVEDNNDKVGEKLQIEEEFREIDRRSQERKRRLSDCVEEEQVRLASENNENEESSVEIVPIVIQVEGVSEKPRLGAAQFQPAESVEDYDQLQAQRGFWSRSDSQISADQNLGESARLSRSSQSISGDDSFISVSQQSSPKLKKISSSSSKQDEDKIGSLPQSSNSVLRIVDNANSYRMSLESNEALQYNKSLKYSIRESTVSARIALSDNMPENLSIDVSRHEKAFHRFSSTDQIGHVLNQIQQNNRVQQETQTDKPRNLIHRESQAQTEIDMEFMVQLLDQLSHKEILENQLYVAQVQLYNLTNVKKESSSASKAKLTQSLVMGLEIVDDKSSGYNNLVPQIDMLDFISSADSADKSQIGSGLAASQSVCAPSQAHNNLGILPFRLGKRCNSLTQLCPRGEAIKLSDKKKQEVVSADGYRDINLLSQSVNVSNLASIHIKGLLKDAHDILSNKNEDPESSVKQDQLASNLKINYRCNDLTAELSKETEEFEIEIEVDSDSGVDEADSNENKSSILKDLIDQNGNLDNQSVNKNEKIYQIQNDKSLLQIDLKLPVPSSGRRSENDSESVELMESEHSVSMDTDGNIIKIESASPKVKQQQIEKAKADQIPLSIFWPQNKEKAAMRQKRRKASIRKNKVAVVQVNEAPKSVPRRANLAQQDRKVPRPQAQAPVVEKFVPSGTRFGKQNTQRVAESSGVNTNSMQNQDRSIQIQTNFQLNNLKVVSKASVTVRHSKGGAAGITTPNNSRQIGTINRQMQQLSKFLHKHGVAGNATGKVSQPQQQYCGASRAKVKTPKTLAQKTQKIHRVAAKGLKFAKASIQPKFESQLAQDQVRVEPQYQSTSSKSESAESLIVDPVPSAKLVLNDVVVSDEDERKAPELTQEPQIACFPNNYAKIPYSPQRARHQSNTQNEMLKKLESIEETKKLQALVEGTAVKTVPSDDAPRIQRLISDGVVVNSQRRDSSSPLDQNNPYLQPDNSSDIYQNGLPSQTSDGEGESSDSQSHNNPQPKSNYFTSRDQGLACFNILDHLRQGNNNSSGGSAIKTQESVSEDEREGTDEQEIQLDLLREHHIQMKQQSKPRKKDHGDSDRDK